MPEKTAPKNGKRYKIDGKTFTWTTDEDAEVVIPMRLKLKVVRSIAGEDLDNVSVMFDLLDKIAPGQADVLDEMDVNDFTECFTTWQTEYNLLTGATPGE